MKKVLLINHRDIPHYRIAVYNRLAEYLRQYDIRLSVAAQGIERGGPAKLALPFTQIALRTDSLLRLVLRLRPDAIILWVGHNPVYFPSILVAKFLGIKIIHWGHRRNLQRPNDILNNWLYAIEHHIDDAIILYAEHLKKYVGKKHWNKVFVANNTLNLLDVNPVRTPRATVKDLHAIQTKKIIIYMGRMQARKRIGDLVRAFKLIASEDVGLVLAGPDPEGILDSIRDKNIYKIDPVYGEKGLDLLAAADVCCIPGAIGLSIVDAFFCGLPVVTQDVLHGPEIMYFKNGINGFMVPAGNVEQLASHIQMLLDDVDLKQRFASAAREEIMTAGHIDIMCKGFRDALFFVFRKKQS